MGDIKDGAGFYRNGRFYWEGEEAKACDDDIKARERRERVNGPEMKPESFCNCGAKHDREFPNIHSPFCNVYKGNK